LWGFNALLFRTDLDSFESVLIAAAAVFTSQLSCQMVIRFDLPAKRGLVQIADALIETSVNDSRRLARDLSGKLDEPTTHPQAGRLLVFGPIRIIIGGHDLGKASDSSASMGGALCCYFGVLCLAFMCGDSYCRYRLVQRVSLPGQLNELGVECRAQG
jgi:hypothetical protein